MKDFRSLKVWEKSHALTLAIYKSTEQSPKQELYSLTNQMQRAAVSIPANIAEGCGKDSDSELNVIFLLLWVRPANLNISFYLHVIWVIFKQGFINPYKVTWLKLAKC